MRRPGAALLAPRPARRGLPPAHAREYAGRDENGRRTRSRRPARGGLHRLARHRHATRRGQPRRHAARQAPARVRHAPTRSREMARRGRLRQIPPRPRIVVGRDDPPRGRHARVARRLRFSRDGQRRRCPRACAHPSRRARRPPRMARPKHPLVPVPSARGRHGSCPLGRAPRLLRHLPRLERRAARDRRLPSGLRPRRTPPRGRLPLRERSPVRRHGAHA